MNGLQCFLVSLGTSERSQVLNQTQLVALPCNRKEHFAEKGMLINFIVLFEVISCFLFPKTSTIWLIALTGSSFSFSPAVVDLPLFHLLSFSRLSFCSPLPAAERTSAPSLCNHSSMYNYGPSCESVAKTDRNHFNFAFMRTRRPQSKRRQEKSRVWN